MICRCCSAASRNSVARSLARRRLRIASISVGALAGRADDVCEAESLLIEFIALRRARPAQFTPAALADDCSCWTMRCRLCPGMRAQGGLALADARMAGEGLQPVRLSIVLHTRSAASLNSNTLAMGRRATIGCSPSARSAAGKHRFHGGGFVGCVPGCKGGIHDCNPSGAVSRAGILRADWRPRGAGIRPWSGCRQWVCFGEQRSRAD
jgi:hypothetical protein